MGESPYATASAAAVVFASRGDHTPRGHFPYEVEALASGLGVKQHGELNPPHLTEFAGDPTFGFAGSDLKAWIQQKTGGAVKAGTVCSISLEMIREGRSDAAGGEFLNASS